MKEGTNYQSSPVVTPKDDDLSDNVADSGIVEDGRIIE